MIHDSFKSEWVIFIDIKGAYVIQTTLNLKKLFTLPVICINEKKI